ncbi:hypothetical protein [Phenylobacterium immobile]|uniref:hypothetical protein n=1 Tax=Phenylobacterium immobile TaxID=21 RepID=UPI000AC11656|nr:hypothetical protein [Phenylobacterium immobile]
MHLVLDARDFELSPRLRLHSTVRYAGVLAVWGALLIIRPRLALQIFHERRPDSPLRRRPPISEGLRSMYA